MTEQSSNLPAVARPTAREVARADTDSWVEVMRPVIALAERIAGTEFVPKNLRNNVAATTAAMLYGREVGLPPMTTLTQTHVIEGKPAMSAEAMRAMVLAAGHTIHIAETTGARCVMRGRRAGADEWTEIVWTIDMARAAGVANKQVWKAYPRQMLQARATTELVRLIFPDVIHGFRSVEEFDVIDGVVVEDEDGNTAAAPAGARVARKRTAAKKTTAARPEPAAAPAARSVEDGPPLPGADDPAPAAVAESSAGGDDGGVSETVPGEDVALPVDDDQDVVDAEVVEEEPPPPLDDEPRAEVDEAPQPGPSSRAQHRMLFGSLDRLAVSEQERHAVVSTLVGREISSFNQLTKDEANTLITTLSMFDGDRARLDALLAEAER
jgi:hypothetical protein